MGSADRVQLKSSSVGEGPLPIITAAVFLCLTGDPESNAEKGQEWEGRWK